MEYEVLRIIWWLFLGVLLMGFAIMDGFDLGVGMLLPRVARTNMERRIVVNTVGPVWEGNQIWLVLGGGAIFAAWPTLYAVSFSGFYDAMLLLLLALILRPVGFKYRSKLESTRWRTCWDIALFIGGLVPSLIFGVALGNVLQGVPFYFDETMRSFYTGGFFGLLNPFALVCGLVSISMFIMHGGIFLSIKTEGEIARRARNYSRIGALLTIVLFALAGLWVAQHLVGYVLTSQLPVDGPSNPLHKTVTTAVGAWMHNYHSYPLLWAVPGVGFLGALLALLFSTIRRFHCAIISSAFSIAGIVGTVGVSMFPFILPSSISPGSSLMVWDSSSSQLTLMIMLVATIIFLPIILAYTSYVYYVMRGKVRESDIEAHSHHVY